MYTLISTCMLIYIYIFVYVYVHVHVHVCMYIQIHTYIYCRWIYLSTPAETMLVLVSPVNNRKYGDFPPNVWQCLEDARIKGCSFAFVSSKDHLPFDFGFGTPQKKQIKQKIFCKDSGQRKENISWIQNIFYLNLASAGPSSKDSI